MIAENRARALRVLDMTENREPTLGLGRLICVDGLAGSGKTTFAAELAGLTRAPVVHLDDLYPGWGGLHEVAREVLPLLTDLAAGVPGRYRRWDWARSRYTGEVEVLPTPLLVLEGVGSGQRAWADLITTLVWIETTQETRLLRGIERDGDRVRAEWLRWQADEQELLSRDQTDVRADLRWRT